MILLIVITASSITALFLRGFKVKNFTEQLKNKDIETPTLEVWLLETQNYDSKMDAYKTGIAAADIGCGVYVLPENEKWTWVAGVYSTRTEAEGVLNQSTSLINAKIQLYQITGKKFHIKAEAIDACRQVLNSVYNIFDLLLNLRIALNKATIADKLLLDLTTQYNLVKSGAETLQNLNTNLQSEFIATVIYTANQNILSLQDIICTNTKKTFSLATLNTALLKTIFSLDNF